jgi:hypothetical protein
MVSEAQCNISVSPNVRVEAKTQVCDQLNITNEENFDKYSGLPSMVGID